MEPIIEVSNVSKKYCLNLKKSLWYGVQDIATHCLGKTIKSNLRKSEFFALNDVSFKVYPGDCIGLMGGNGAGKSTLLKMINGLILPDKGTIKVTGKVGGLIELGAGFNGLLTGRENIAINAAIIGMTSGEVKAKTQQIIEFADLGPYIDSPVQSYSSGMRIRLGFAIAAHLNPNILLIDEVLAVGDTAFRMRCFERLKQLQTTGTAIVLVSHNPIDLERMCNRSLLLTKGKLELDTDLATGLSTYESLLATSMVNATTTPNAPASFTKIQLKSNSLKTFDALSATLTISTTDPQLPLRVLVNVISPNTGVLGSVTSNNNVVLQGQTQYDVTLTLPDLPLQFGGYVLQFWLYGPNLTNYYASSQPIPFKIVGPKTDSFGFGPSHTVYFHNTWTK